MKPTEIKTTNWIREDSEELGYSIRLKADYTDIDNPFLFTFEIMELNPNAASKGSAVAGGTIKWDGCLELNSSVHICGLEEMIKYVSIIRTLPHLVKEHYGREIESWDFE